MPDRAARKAEAPVEALIAGLAVEELREVVLAAVDRHDDVERQVRLIVARGAGDLAQLRVEVDRGLRTALDAWPLEQDAARATLQRADPRGFVNALLADGEPELAWSAAVAAPQEALGSDLWLRLAESRERDRPADALAVYQRVVGEVLEATDRRAYRSAARILGRAQAAAQSAGELDAFGEYLARLREQHRRRPTLIAILDKANLR